ncbi:MAG: response regulator [Candidatus Marinimicrobia bacterium]|nr:response regulator [Candidatus Neomarinimicrobiota bacterium]
MVKILVVEDDQFTQDFIREVLEEDGNKVATAPDGEGALSQLKKNVDTQLVLLDIMLPGRSGWDIFMELRHDHPKLKVVFVSAIEVSDERRLSLINKEGLADYIVKPFTQERLREAVEKIFGKK